MMEQFSTSNIVHYEVDSVVFLINIVHFNNEWMLNFKHNQLFQFYFVNDILVDDIVLLQTFDCKVRIAFRKVR